MNYYETLYIVHPALESGRLKDIIMDIEDCLKQAGGTPLAVDLWGKRKLAYFIDKQKYGTYVLLQYNGEGKCPRAFAIDLEHNPNILSYITTNITHDDLIKQEDDLETQIAGKTRESERTSEKNDAKPNQMTSDSSNQQTDSAIDNVSNEENKIQISKEDEEQTNSNIENIDKKKNDESQIDKDNDNPANAPENIKTLDKENITEETAEKLAVNNEKE